MNALVCSMLRYFAARVWSLPSSSSSSSVVLRAVQFATAASKGADPRLHVSVLLDEVLEQWTWRLPTTDTQTTDPAGNAPSATPRLYVDCTLGMGGHSLALLEREPGAVVLGLDRDRSALDVARGNLRRRGLDPARLHTFHGSFADVGRAVEAFLGARHPPSSPAAAVVTALRGAGETKGGGGGGRLGRRRKRTAAPAAAAPPAGATAAPAAATAAGAGAVAGILADLGLSSMQLALPDRGFSFAHPDAPLDMRFDGDEDALLRMFAGSLVGAEDRNHDIGGDVDSDHSKGGGHEPADAAAEAVAAAAYSKSTTKKQEGVVLLSSPKGEGAHKAATTAAVLLATLSQRELEVVFADYGEERHARMAAQLVVRALVLRRDTWSVTFTSCCSCGCW